MWTQIARTDTERLSKAIENQKAMSDDYNRTITPELIQAQFENKEDYRILFYDADNFEINLVLRASDRKDGNYIKLQTTAINYKDPMVRQDHKAAAIIVLTKMKELLPKGFAYYASWSDDVNPIAARYYKEVANNENAKIAGLESCITEIKKREKGGFSYVTVWK